MMSIDEINKRIIKETCYETCFKLTDAMLLNKYKSKNSFKNKKKEISDIINKYNINNEKLINELTINNIPPGLKGNIKGLEFNRIVKEKILGIKIINNIRWNIRFEKRNIFYKTDEIPDWYISDNFTRKILIGMNQIDLWSGGAQLNRGYKYIINQKQYDDIKIICVVCNTIQLKSKKCIKYFL